MLFNSSTFIIFFCIVLIISRCIGSWTVRKGFLLVVSYIFYAAWNPPLVMLLWVSTIADWFCAQRIHTAPTKRIRKLILLISLGINLGLLGFFKYSGFLMDNFVYLMNLLQIEFSPASPNIILPMGISFYTFQTLSYTIDIYRGRSKPWPSFLDYALYVTFFPQLVAGPIVRAAQFLPQCAEQNKATSDQISWGLTLLVIGLFSKVVIADGLTAPIVEQVYDSGKVPGMYHVWVATCVFSIQLFCDFAGYSTCAIGAALCLGFKLPVNFRYPYAAIGFSDFWRRWHITLSSWLRDYVYFALGGSRRRGYARTYINQMITMLLAGLWHGAAWTYVLFGGLHGFYITVERVLKGYLGHYSVWRLWPMRIFFMLLTYAGFVLSLPVFRSHDVSQAFTIITSMIGLHPLSFQSEPILYDHQVRIGIFCTAGILISHYLMRNSSLEEAFSRIHWSIRGVAVAVLAYLTLISYYTGEDRAFIYFQF